MDVTEVLIRRNVIVDGDGAEFGLSDEFSAAVDAETEHLASNTETERADLVRARCGVEESSIVLDRCGDDTERLGRYLALYEQTADIPLEDRLGLFVGLEAVARDPAPDSGAPELFLPVHADQLAFYLSSVRKAVVYVWRDDCPPCETVRSDLDTLVTDPIASVGLFAVYGPGDPETLADQYDVRGGPTLLFVVDGKVDIRLQGAQYTDIVEKELSHLADTELA
ncbi:hypothetical protein GJR96_15830 [Haloferax sp. MBLA0076]|uniref:Thioredoxin domain-containing protein n=1 Tax=Haloferax litoreum TaxID=2666140 RepID=A0A6A8GLP6_9EURY|nr:MULTISPECIES: thioredoxin family protein [Haloferax]KAB1190447.1 thioredoxin family protein [Haloferax sp. CBA1148]MRX23422.1 hypothetical protein [Haloferax litoreum]